MTKTLAVILSVALLAIAGVHLYWGLGGFWPAYDNDSLVGMVVGLTPGNAMPPLWACVVMAICVMVPVVAVLLIAFGWRLALPRLFAWIPTAALWSCVFVFVTRGLATYTPIFDAAQSTAFFDLNRMFYGPLCLALGAGLAMVWFSTPKSGIAPK
jgi:hypothetical protein